MRSRTRVLVQLINFDYYQLNIAILVSKDKSKANKKENRIEALGLR